MALNWKSRCRKDQTAAADRKIWETKCGRYRVVFSHIRYGNVLSDKWYAEYRVGNGWGIISKHIKKHTAMKACENRHRARTAD